MTQLRPLNTFLLLGLAGALAIATGGCLEDGADETDSLRLQDLYEIPEGVHVGYHDFGRGPAEVAYRVVDGVAIHGGDMVLGDANIIAEQSPDDDFRSAILTSGDWPSNRIMYVIDPGADDKTTIIENAMAMWESQTVFRFAEWNGSLNVPFLRFSDTDGACRSWVGRQPLPPGVGQQIWINDTCQAGNVAHEIGHAMGLLHEHTRKDRDNFVLVDLGNIPDNVVDNYFSYTMSYPDGDDWRGYDFNSIMHYGSNLAGGQTVMVRNQSGCSFNNPSSSCTFTGQRSALSGRDITGATRVLTDGFAAHQIRSDETELCLRPEGGSHNSGTPIVEASCPSNSDSRRWIQYFPQGSGSEMLLVNKMTRQCITYEPATDGFVQRPCDTSSNQRFRWKASNGSGSQLELRSTGQCMRHDNSAGVFLSNSCVASSKTRRWKITG